MKYVIVFTKSASTKITCTAIEKAEDRIDAEYCENCVKLYCKPI